MSSDIEITAGRDGGNFDALIAYMGNPRAFGFSSRSPHHILFAEGRGDTGQSIDMIKDNDATMDLHLLGPSGQVLVALHWTSIAYLVPAHSSADSALDGMMNGLQSGGPEFHPFEVSFRGRGGNDIFSGSVNNDILAGAAGDDVLSGRGGHDVITGGFGDDTLDGGNGSDRLTGGGGADWFAFGSASAAGGDRITDFHLSEGDKIDLRLVDAIKGTAAVDTFSFIDTDSFGHHSGELRLQVLANGTVIQGDTNGDGTADFRIVVSVATDLDLSALILI